MSRTAKSAALVPLNFKLTDQPAGLEKGLIGVELHAYLLAHLRTRDGVLLFKSSNEHRRCEESL